MLARATAVLAALHALDTPLRQTHAFVPSTLPLRAAGGATQQQASSALGLGTVNARSEREREKVCAEVCRQQQCSMQPCVWQGNGVCVPWKTQ